MIPSNDKMATDGYTDKGVAFSIDEEDMSFIFGILRNNMYSNPIKICVQEPLCNGRDAAREINNVSKPMEVELPFDDFGYFTVRDFGPSLTYDQMVNVFCKYGKSTKRGTNQTGGFGIGAKSPWAYNNEFFVDTFINNEKTSYRFYIDSETERGKMEIISTSKVETENGLKVIIPVKDGDEFEFINNFEFTTRYWGVKPKVINGFVEYKNYQVEMEDDWVLYKDFGAYSSAAVLVDDIPYPIDTTAFELPEELNEFSKLPIHLFCGADDVDVAASREQLNYTKKTINYILSELQRAYDTCYEIFSSDISKMKTYSEAYCEWNCKKNSKWRDLFNITWNGHNLNINNFLKGIPLLCRYNSSDPDVTKIYEATNFGGYLYKSSRSTLSLSYPILMIYGSKRFPNVRVNRAINSLYKKTLQEKDRIVTCICLPNDTEKEKLVVEYLKTNCKLDNLDVYNLNDFDKHDNKDSESGYTKKDKTHKNKGNISEVYLGSECNSKKLFVDISEIEGYYCESKYSGLDFFNDGVFRDKDHSFNIQKSIVSQFGIQKIYSIPKKFMEVAKKNCKLTSIADVINLNKTLVYDKTKCDIIKNNVFNSYLTRRCDSIYTYISKHIRENIEKLDTSSPMRCYFERYSFEENEVSSKDKEYLQDMETLYGYESSTSNFTDISVEDKQNIKKIYPLLIMCDRYSLSKECIDHVILYIKSVDYKLKTEASKNG